MYIETLGKGLEMAVEAAFSLDYETREEITYELEGVSLHGLEQVLHMARLNQYPGLKAEISKAYVSGNQDEITHMQKVAQEQGQLAFRRKAARIAVQNKGQDSRIKQNNINQWNDYGYLL